MKQYFCHVDIEEIFSLWIEKNVLIKIKVRTGAIRHISNDFSHQLVD
jgi:hypothetical protein